MILTIKSVMMMNSHRTTRTAWPSKLSVEERQVHNGEKEQGYSKPQTTTNSQPGMAKLVWAF